MNKLLILFFILIVFISSLHCQVMNKMQIIGNAQKVTQEIVPRDKIDANLKKAALVAFLTDI